MPPTLGACPYPRIFSQSVVQVPGSRSHRLPEGATNDLKAFAMAQLRLGLPWTPSRQHDDRHGELCWNLQEDRVEARY